MTAPLLPSMSDSSAFPPSLWAATAIAKPDCPPLEGDADCDVAIVGAGFTGLTAALSAAEAGASVIVLEAGEPGWGASGRNGGQVNAGLKIAPYEIEAKFGREASAKIIAFASTTTDVVWQLIEKHKINCDGDKAGLLFCVAKKAHMEDQRKVTSDWAARGAPVRWADEEETAHLTGATGYLGAMVDMRCGTVQPLSYARGLADAAMKAGARICGQTKVTSLKRENDRFAVSTAKGVVSAKKVILATNGYSGFHASGLSPALDRSIIPISSFIVATEPLSDNLRKSILPEGHCTADTRRFLYYTRFDKEGRLVFGGRGLLREPKSADDFAHLQAGIAKVYPQVRDVPISYCWSGRLALTMDKIPHLHEPEPGLMMGLGYNGRGVAAASALGTALGEYAATGNRDVLPLSSTDIPTIAFHGMREPFMAAGFAWHRAMDALGL
ncbi:MAG: NAD(P)/FAD-dependent oxidoreductase [Hyphomicrobiales bacterium]